MVTNFILPSVQIVFFVSQFATSTTANFELVKVGQKPYRPLARLSQ